MRHNLSGQQQQQQQQQPVPRAMASFSHRSAQPESMPQLPAFLPRPPAWRRPPPGILKTPPGFFSLPRRHSAKTLRFQVDERAGSPASGVRRQSYAMTQDLAGAGSSVIASASGPPKSQRSESSSPTSTESSSDDKPYPRGVKRRHSPSPAGGRRNSSACEVGSAAPYWMPEEIRHYFLNYDNDEDESGDGKIPDLKKGATASASALQRIGLERPPQGDGVNADSWKRFARQPHCVLVALCFAAVFALILAAMSSDLYSGLIHGVKGDKRTTAAAGANGAYSRAAEQGSASGRVESRSKEERQGEKAKKAERVGARRDKRRNEGMALDEKTDENEKSSGDLVLEGGTGWDQTETDVDKRKPARPMVTVDPAGTRANAAEAVRGLEGVEAITFQSRVRIVT
ncbi:uncharacterized protein LOC119439622 [Dermacentor silvarum]|uniref:uncharacterized protein LOC119439622 n=1 Tax=Dermacentor silvarum TaxID=543639 RepID=UPI0021018600|nr:uncharacterized protein LOC119439622 [Dermacentor silvarum]